ncbi:MAG: hypothetical protein K2M07_04025 [Muribaculaceae bacterium]|nr:hypothetical protein [Muribaculaceae bacterium]
MDIHIAWASALLCSLRIGNAKAAERGTGQQARLHAFSFINQTIANVVSPKAKLIVMSANLLEMFQQWLIQNGITTTSHSTASYMTRLRKSFKIWNRKSKILVPIESNLGTLQYLVHNRPDLLDDLFNLMIRYVCDDFADGKISEGYKNDICTAVRRFQEYLTSVAGKNNISVSPAVMQGLASSVSNELTASEEFYPDELNLRNRISSRNSTYWPASKLGDLIGKNSDESWITQALKKVSVLTEKGPHRVIDIEKMRVGKGDILEVMPKIYSKGAFVKAYGYHANGSIHPFKVARDANGTILLSSISIDHSPAISLIIKSGRFPEFQNLINGLNVNPRKLKKEYDLINEMEFYLLMERSQNSAKGNRW